MRLVLDACVLYPSIMRSALLAVAKTGAFEPIWSPRLLEEWRRAAARRSVLDSVVCEGEITLMNVDWPKSLKADVENTSAFWLPDPNDIHVLALAVQSRSDGIITVNKKDFPNDILLENNILRHDPDAFLVTCFHQKPDAVRDAITNIVTRAQQDLPDFTPLKLLKKARLPRLAKAITAVC